MWMQCELSCIWLLFLENSCAEIQTEPVHCENQNGTGSLTTRRLHCGSGTFKVVWLGGQEE